MGEGGEEGGRDGEEGRWCWGTLGRELGSNKKEVGKKLGD